MEAVGVALQQVQGQLNVALSAVKQKAQAQQALVGMIDQAVSQGARGQKLDISI